MVKTRYTGLDELRGFTLLVMIAYHAVWDIVYLFGVKLPWFQSQWAYIWQQAICCTFIFVSGMCQSFGKKRWRHSLRVFALGALITAVTALAVPENIIVFGILTFIGSAKLLCLAAEPVLRRCPAGAGALASLAAFALTKNIGRGYLGFAGRKLLDLPQSLYADYFTAFLGFPGKDFFSADYFPLLPWLFLFLCGYYTYLFAHKHNLMKVFQAGRCKLLEWLGKRSLWIYLAHQPVVYALLWCIFAVGRIV